MRGYEELDLEDLSEPGGHPGESGGGTDREGDRPVAAIGGLDVPPAETIRSALYGAVRFAEALLGAAGASGARLSRLIGTPDGRSWTLSLGGHFFRVEILGDGFAVRPLRPAARAFAAQAR